MLHKKGFSFIELLIVILLLSLLFSVVSPMAYKQLKKIETYIKETKRSILIKKAHFLSFIKEKPCTVDNGKVVCK